MSPITYANKHRLSMVLVCFLCLMIGCATAIIIGRTEAPTPYWIIFGGNTDPGDGNGGGLARDQMIAGGWTTPENSFQVTWDAHIEQGTIQQANEAIAAGTEAYNQHCNGKPCVIAGFSLGTSPALQLSDTLGHPADMTYIFGGPQPSTGIWHQQYQDNPFVEPFVQSFGQLNTNRPVRQGTQVFYDSRDPYANAAPQCSGPGLFALTLDGHYIVSKQAADNSRIWTGIDGAVMHEVGYQAVPFGLPRSGSDPSQPWDGCGLGDWQSTFNNSLPQLPIPTPGG